MKRILTLLFLLFTTPVWAGTAVLPTTYAPNGQVTNVNLNGNFNALASVLNGGIDNNNVDTLNGYRLS